MNLVIEKFPAEARELILLAPLIFDKARQTLAEQDIKPSILHGNLSPQATHAVRYHRNGQTITHGMAC
jgi:hypothetical protein